jgi:hypothetical protein
VFDAALRRKHVDKGADTRSHCSHEERYRPHPLARSAHFLRLVHCHDVTVKFRPKPWARFVQYRQLHAAAPLPQHFTRPVR